MRLSAVLILGLRCSAGALFGSAGLRGAPRVTILAPRGSTGLRGGPRGSAYKVDTPVIRMSEYKKNKKSFDLKFKKEVGEKARANKRKLESEKKRTFGMINGKSGRNRRHKSGTRLLP